MERHLRGCLGGIFGLLDLIDEHREALEYELLMAHYRIADLGSGLLTWRDLFVLVRRWQKIPGNALAASVYGAEVPAWTEQVLATVVDQLQSVNFNLRKGKGQRPKPFERWWNKKKTQKFGSNPVPISQFDAWWDSKKAR